MKKWNCLFLFLFLLQSLLAQKTNGTVSYFKEDGSPTTKAKEASFLQHTFPLDDTTFITRYYNYAGPMITQASYRDQAMTIPEGRFCWYNASGRLDSSGGIRNGKKTGSWEYFPNKNKRLWVTYEDGVKVKDTTYYYDDDGKVIPADSSDKDTTLIAAAFRKGIEDWISYIRKNLKTPTQLQKVLKEGNHQCMVSFLVNKEGYTREIFMMRSCEWSGDAEAMRLIADSPPWHPATKDGKPVWYRQLQPLTYAVLSK